MSNKVLENKTAFITGGTSGIGEGSAKYLASVGLNVIIFGRSSENGKRIEKEINELGVGKAFYVQGDVTSEEDQKRALEEGEKKFGGIHFAFANAGILGGNEDLLTINISEVRRLLESNFFGALITLQQVAPYFKKNGGGTIVFNSSIFGLWTRKFVSQINFLSNYLVSKTAVDGLVKVASSLEKTHNIKAYSVNPSIFLSEMTLSNKSATPNQLAQNANVLFKRCGNATVIGKVLEHCFDGTTKYLNGQGIVVEYEYTFPSQFFYDKYSTDEDIDPNDLLHNYLRDLKGEKFSENEIKEIQEKIKQINEENEKLKTQTKN